MSAPCYGPRGIGTGPLLGRQVARNSRHWEVKTKPPPPPPGTGTGFLGVVGYGAAQKDHGSGGYHIDCKTITSRDADWPNVSNFGTVGESWKGEWKAVLKGSDQVQDPSSVTTSSFRPPWTRDDYKGRHRDLYEPRRGDILRSLGYDVNNTTKTAGWMHKECNDTFNTTYGDMFNVGVKGSRRPGSASLSARRHYQRPILA